MLGLIVEGIKFDASTWHILGDRLIPLAPLSLAPGLNYLRVVGPETVSRTGGK